MCEDRDNMMNLDLNLGPSAPLSPDLDPDLGPLSAELGNMDIRHLEAVAVRARHCWRWRQGRLSPGARNMPTQMIVSTGEPRTGEGSIAVHNRTITDGNKTCKGNASDLLAKALRGSNDAEKGNGSGDGGSFFECNICLDIARNPVLTCCGHLFCWPCLYQWLHIHSDSKECPVCKGEVTVMNIMPIYGRGNDTHELEKADESGLKIPPRPNAQRFESRRQWIHREDSYFARRIRRIGSRFDVMGEWTPPQGFGAANDMHDRAYSLSNRILRTHGIRREGSGQYSLLEQSFGRPEQEIVDLTQGSRGVSEAEGSQQLPSLQSIRSHSQRAASVSHLSSAERLVQAYFLGHPMRRNHTHSPPVEDTDSVSNIATVMQSETDTG